MEVLRHRARFRNGFWYAIIVWEDDNGATHEKSVKLGCKNEQEAGVASLELFYRAKLGEIELKPARNSDKDLFMYAFDYFKGRLDRHEYERSTFSSNLKHMRAWEKALGRRSLSKVTEKDVKNAISEWFSDGRDATTVDKRMTALNEVYKNAVHDGLCTRNPLEHVRRPKKQYKELNGINDSETLSKAAAAIARMPLDSFKVAFSLALYTGMRRGEVCALEWRNVDLERGLIWVRSSIGADDCGKYVKPPKSNRPRDIAMPDTLRKLLVQWRAECKQEFAYVVCDSDGNYFNPDYVTHVFTSFARFNALEGAAGRRLTLHDLRHTAATVLIGHGADVKTVQSVLGHSSAAITLDMYASADSNAKRSAAAILDLAI